MKPELSEQFFIQELFNHSVHNKKIEQSGISVIDRLTGDASTRRYYRVNAGDKSYVVCLDNPIADAGGNLFVQKQTFLNENHVRVPLIFDYYPDRGYILEEDLGNQTLLHWLAGVSTIEVELEMYKRCVDLLLSFQKVNENKISECGLFTEAFDFNKLMSEVEFTVNHFIKNFIGIKEEESLNKIKDLYSPICQRLANEKMVLTHRDYHSRNIMIKNDELIVIDFQDARMGIPQYDLASLLDDCYYAIDSKNKEILIKYYFEKAGKEFIGQDYDKFLELYDDMVLQRAFKAIGSFSYIWKLRGDYRYVKYIGYTMEKMRRLMMGKKQYNHLKLLLSKIYYDS